jgi:glutathione synthase/RimK-type ligase-like ATP-grasp enzyme
MTKEVLLLFSYETYPSGRQPYVHHADILNRVQDDGHRLQFTAGVLHELRFVYDGLALTVTEPRTGRDLTGFDLVFFQKWMDLPQHALAAAQYLDAHEAPFMSREVLHQNPISKLTELPLLAQAALPIPKTVVAPLSAIKELYDAGTLPFGLPCIIKDIRGSQGSNNYLIRDAEELLAVEAEFPDLTFMAQEFIENDCDYRITIMGGEVQYVLRRTRRGDTHLNNTSQGGEGEFVANDYLPPVVLADAVKAAQALGRTDFAGVDVIVDSAGKHWILEVNKSPEIQTGYDFAHKSKILVDYLEKRIG